MAGGCELEPDPGFDFCDICGQCGAGYHVCECDEECAGTFCSGADRQSDGEDDPWNAEGNGAHQPSGRGPC